ncbi:hypothetical protein MSSIH_1713 [Methanosarcina siciliae HI350]|uniref:Uncharacterized protein n=1 Tax=Methanosarcina siciliae HI350 TaxID=1434119 RepID=A0A0E3PEW0_9EURY|nr:hypothetical protein MSSIH_1713 [Methanosarcina siciliae HI350]
MGVLYHFLFKNPGINKKITEVTNHFKKILIFIPKLKNSMEKFINKKINRIFAGLIRHLKLEHSDILE